MEKLMRAAASTIGRRSFFRSFGKLGMGAAAVAAVLLLPKRASAQIPCPDPDRPDTYLACDNNGGPCALPAAVGDPCGHNDSKMCMAAKPNSVDSCAFHCQCA